jgi:predicted dehydrogenase
MRKVGGFYNGNERSPEIKGQGGWGMPSRPLKEKLKLGIIGCGRIAKLAHLPAIVEIRDMVELMAVVDSDKGRASGAYKKYGAKKYYVNLEEALTDPDIEALVMCLPNYLHAEMTLKALNARKHVLIEKPLALTVDEADRMIKAAETNSRKLMVAHNRRFFKAAAEAKQRMGEIGKPFHIVYVWLYLRETPLSEWWVSAEKTGGLVLQLAGCHAIDLMLWLTGKTPVRVYAEKNRNNPIWEGEDDVSILLGFDDGLIATLSLSLNARHNVHEMNIVGSEKTMALRDEGTLIMNGKILVEDNKPLESFKNQLREFVMSIREDREPLTSAKDVRKVVEVLSAVRLSAQERKVVTL